MLPGALPQVLTCANGRIGERFSGRAKTPSFDDLTIWTGCVVRNDRNSWTLFYTGTSRAEEGKIQRIGRASSADLVHWRRQGLALERTGENAEYYEGCVPRRWKDCSLRDPWVIRDPEGSGWLMYFTARSPMPSDTNASGAIGVAHSHDLVNWQLQPPVYVGSFGESRSPKSSSGATNGSASSAHIHNVGRKNSNATIRESR
ncbi:MAG: hypothetical protein E5Y61_15725 [Mesorhizobium sp.]|nr:MAG: hypothetical protein E5Y61_15725 [Mesorhizobium sp.]